jgi:hypothetical protein
VPGTEQVLSGSYSDGLSTGTQARTGRAVDDVAMSTPARPGTTTAFFAQAAISFAVSSMALGLGIAYIAADPWVRAFLGIATLYVITSTFTLAKCIRDRQEETAVVSRVDKARLDKLLAEHDPFKVEGV